MAERMDPWSGRRASGEDEITFTSVRILDGTSERPYPGEMTVAENRIRSITRSGGGYQWNTNGGQRIDGRDATLMPGMVDAHLHLSWSNAPGIDPIQMMPIEEHMLVREGYFADLLLVDGDPSVDGRVLQDQSRLVATMKDGKFHKAPKNGVAYMRLTA